MFQMMVVDVVIGDAPQILRQMELTNCRLPERLDILLGEEQKTDEAKKEQCEKDIDETENKHKQLNVEIADLEKVRRPRRPLQLSVTRSLP
jgi:hypothetical protein